MLTLLVFGPRKPKNNIDIYLQPLSDELHDLQAKGIETYDTFSKTTFNMKVVLMLAMHDFLTYRNLS